MLAQRSWDIKKNDHDQARIQDTRDFHLFWKRHYFLAYDKSAEAGDISLRSMSSPGSLTSSLLARPPWSADLFVMCHDMELAKVSKELIT